MAKAYCVEDYRKKAQKRLPKMVFDFLDGGAESEKGLDRNIAAYDAWRFLPRRLQNVEKISLDVKLWDRNYPRPFYISPTGLNGLLRAGGDAMLARAAAKIGIPFALSTASNLSIEDAARASDGEKWFQLYIMDRDIADTMVQRALDAQYDALILTVDVPVNGYRERDMRNGFGVPAKYTPRTMIDGAMHPLWSLDFLCNGVPKLQNFETAAAVNVEAQAALMSRKMDASFNWDDLARLREKWPRKLIVKGLSRVDDAQRCAALGVDAVILSNHGGRQLDGTEAPVSQVEAVSQALDIPVFFDSGIRRGADVIKGLCLGATMAGLGRATLYALAAEGELGVSACLDLLTEEMNGAMALLGAPDIAALDRDLLT